MRLAIAIAAAIVLVAAPAQAADYTLRVKGRDVTAIGGFKPQSDPTLGAAISVFGAPSSTRSNGAELCRVGWRNIALRINFVNLGAPGAVPCDPSVMKAQTASAFGRVWRTSRGLRIRSTTRKLRRLYPRALRRGRTYRLVGATSRFGDGRRYSVLAAKTRKGRVGSFKLFIGAAGE